MIETDVVVVGAGVAGQSLAVLLKARGIDHVVLDRVPAANRRGQDFALGETIPPSALPMLQSLGLLSVFKTAACQETYGYHWSWGSERLQSDHFFGRSRFHHGLKLDKARLLQVLGKLDQGQRIRYDTGLRVHERPDGVILNARYEGRELHLSAKLVIDATGRHRAVARQFGGNSRRVDDLLAFSCHLPHIEQSGLIHGVYVEAFEHGWGLVSRLDEANVVMSMFTSRHSPVRRQLMQYAAWPAILADTVRLKTFASADIAPPDVVGRDASTTLLDAPFGHRWLAIGDAAFTLDPLSSHGITTAVYAAKRAAEAIQAHQAGSGAEAFADYGQSMGRIFRTCLEAKRQRYRTELRWRDTPFWQRARDISGSRMHQTQGTMS